MSTSHFNSQTDTHTHTPYDLLLLCAKQKRGRTFKGGRERERVSEARSRECKLGDLIKIVVELSQILAQVLVNTRHVLAAKWAPRTCISARNDFLHNAVVWVS